MKPKYYLPLAAGIISVAVIMAGCVKQPLDTAPVGNYTTQNFWRDQTDVLAGIAGIYNIMFQEDGVGHGNYVFEDQSDDISVDGDHADYWRIESFNPLASDYQIRTTWIFAYEQIARANNAIIYVPQVPVMDEAIRNRSLGEAYFLRAHAYYTLQTIYGEVPLILEENVLNGEYNQPKKTEEEVRVQIEADLLKAADLLPETYGGEDKGRVHKGAAWALLTKLYMTWEKLDKAQEYGQKVITNANYALAPEYSDNFIVDKQINNSEILFGIWSKDGFGSAVANIYFTNRAWGGWGFHHPTQNFVDAFEAGDTKRKEATVLAVGDSIPNQNQMIEISDKDAYQMFAGKEGQLTGRMLPSQSPTGYSIRKYTGFKADGSGLDFSIKQPLLRTADIYLLVAEAKIRTSGPGAGDAEINVVRKRAGLGEISGATFTDLVHERRVELGGENVRHFDLLRWDKKQLVNLDTIVNKPKAASPLQPYNGTVIVPARTFTRPKNYYQPIPQSIVDQSKGIITQNPNY
ncbi:RagB/SusD family nutrient uptake outer membrane protein [Foetidibacter luteolus]|uniref:RagB/SusD family nutrient uptake outer membrane protein n=1 Tax=Foetidibacter luteolus TaxID=2608880 RepID=UPI00129B8948|nr:RagB/SusD family nutrient uptake outer membrane protein [Foetidibacter luteolus]